MNTQHQHPSLGQYNYLLNNNNNNAQQHYHNLPAAPHSSYQSATPTSYMNGFPQNGSNYMNNNVSTSHSQAAPSNSQNYYETPPVAASSISYNTQMMTPRSNSTQAYLPPQTSYPSYPSQQPQYSQNPFPQQYAGAAAASSQLLQHTNGTSSGATSMGYKQPASFKVLRRSADRPVVKLSVELLKTYKHINAVYYAEKKKREQQQQQQHQQQMQYQQQAQLLQQQQQHQMQMQQNYNIQMKNNQQPVLAQQAASMSQMPQVAQIPQVAPNIVIPPQQPIIQPQQPVVAPNGTTNDGYDDADGNYIVQLGEELDNRFVAQEVLGKGSFGVVVKAYDTMKNETVAVKIIKNKYQFYQQAKIEIGILRDLGDKDTEGKYNIVQLKHYFLWRKHLCLVFELLSYNLYDLLKYTKFKGVSLTLIKKFAYQLLQTLSFLSRNDVKVIHCDLKPENILLKNHRKSAIKVIDFGSSCYVNKKMYKYIQSRFYRSPEVLLGNSYSCSIDMWSLGCILVEMHIGVPLFDGKDEADQIRKIVAVLGLPPTSMIQKSPKKQKFFFYEPAIQQFKLKAGNPVAQRTLQDIIGVYSGGPSGRRANNTGHSTQDYIAFYDLVSRMLHYDPACRIRPQDALAHAFFNTTTPSTPASEQSPLTIPVHAYPTGVPSHQDSQQQYSQRQMSQASSSSHPAQPLQYPHSSSYQQPFEHSALNSSAMNFDENFTDF